MLTSEVLRKAKELIVDPCDWWKAGYNQIGGHCTSLALSRIGELYRDANPWAARDAISRVLGLPLDNLEAIYAWNDAPERTHGDVMLAFATAIEYEEAREAASREQSPTARPAPVPALT